MSSTSSENCPDKNNGMEIQGCSPVHSKPGWIASTVVPFICSWEGCLLVLRISRFVTVLYVVYSLGCIIQAIMVKTGNLAAISAKASAETVGHSFAQHLVKYMLGTRGVLAYPDASQQIPIITYRDRFKIIPDAIGNMSLDETTPVLKSLLICGGQLLVSKFLHLY